MTLSTDPAGDIEEALDELTLLLNLLVADAEAAPSLDPAAQLLVTGQDLSDAAHWLNEWSTDAVLSALEAASEENVDALEGVWADLLNVQGDADAVHTYLTDSGYSEGTVGILNDTMPVFLGGSLYKSALQLDALAGESDPRTEAALQALADVDTLEAPEAFARLGRQAVDTLFARANKLHMELTGGPLNVQMPADRVQGTVTAPPTGPDPALPEPPVVTPTIEVDAGTVFALIVKRPSPDEAVDLLTGRRGLTEVVARTVNTFASRAEAELASDAMLSAAQQTRQDRKTEVGLAVKSVKAGEVLTATDAQAKAPDLILAFTANGANYSVEEVAFVDEEVVPVETPVSVPPPMESGALGVWIKHLEAAEMPVGMPVSIADTLAAATAAIFTGQVLDTPESRYVGLIQGDANLKDLLIEEQQRQTDAAQVAREQIQKRQDVDASNPQTYWTTTSGSDLPETVRDGGAITVEGNCWARVLIPAANVPKQLAAYGDNVLSDAAMQDKQAQAATQEPTGPKPEPAPTVEAHFTILDDCRVIVDHASIEAAKTLGYTVEGSEGDLLLLTTPGKETIQAEPFDSPRWPPGAVTYVLTALGESLGDSPPLPVGALLGELNRRQLSKPLGGSLDDLLTAKCGDGGELDVSDVLGAITAKEPIWGQLAANDFGLKDGWTRHEVEVQGESVVLTLAAKGMRQTQAFDFRFQYSVFPDADSADVNVRFFVDNADYGSTVEDGLTLANATSPPAVFSPFALDQITKAYPWWDDDLEAIQRAAEQRLRDAQEAIEKQARGVRYEEVRKAAMRWMDATTNAAMLGEFDNVGA